MEAESDTKLRRILVIDDDPASLDITSEALRWEGYETRTALTGIEGLQAIQDWDPDLVILDVNMPQLNGIDTLYDLRKRDHYVSVIFISGSSGTEAITRGLDAGADDYVSKPFDPLEFLARVRTQLRIKDLHDQLRTMNEKLKELVDIDDLTGLFNMRSIYQKLAVELARARRFSRQVGVVMLDMDHFKSVNDGHDHLFGSYVLSEVGGIIRGTIRATDIAARYGGDEFLIVLTDVTADGIRSFCERLRATIEVRTFDNGIDRIQLTASMGFALIAPGQSGVDPRNLVRTADFALYEAKRAGRNCVRSMELQDQTNDVTPALDSKTKRAG